MHPKNAPFFNEDKSIVIGCDQTIVLATMLKNLRHINKYNVITAGRVSDMVRVVNSVNPLLIILHYRDNQYVLDHSQTTFKKRGIPIICFTHDQEWKTLTWQYDRVVITEPIAFIAKENFLRDLVNSILRLLHKPSPLEPERSIADRNWKRSDSRITKNLSRYALELDQKIKTLRQVQEGLKGMFSEVSEPVRLKLVSYVSTIKQSITDQKHWEDFKAYFENINPNFLKQIAQRHPDLSSKDVKYCCYVKMNMSNNDIGHILGINQESVRTHKYRLKKKLALPKYVNLQNYIKSIA